MTPRRTGLLLLALALVLGLAPTAMAQNGPQALDLDAQDNVAAALDWSRTTFPDGTDEVLLGRADNFADNLASGGLQGATATLPDGRALLLTDTNGLRQDVIDELARLAPTVVHILGGEAAISNATEMQLETLGYTTNRFAGLSRIETAVEAAEALDTDTALLVRAFPSPGGDDTQAFADTIAAAAWAAENGYAVLFTQTEVLTGSTRDHITAAGYSTVFIVGGEAAISAEVEDEVEGLVDTVTRVAGQTRFQTAIAIAEQRGLTSHDDAGLSILVDGQGINAWADGFAAAALAGNGGFPIVLGNSAAETLPQETVDFLSGDGLPEPPVLAFSQDVEPYSLICGVTAPDAQCEEAAEILEVQVVSEPKPGDEANTTFIVTPADFAEIANTADEQATRAFSVDNPVEGETHTIALVPAGNVTIDEVGVVSFESTEDSTAADLGATDAVITSVNGADTAGDSAVATAEPSPGLTFAIASATYDEVIEVVFFDADGDGALDLNPDGTPISDEPFGIGGETRILPQSADTGQNFSLDIDVQFVDASRMLISGENRTYTVSDADTLVVADPAQDDAGVDGPSPLACQGDDTAIATWLGLVTPGDQLDASLTYDPENGSTVCLEDVSPAAPALAAGDSTTSTIDLTITDVEDDATVSVYFATRDADDNVQTDPSTDDFAVADATDADPDTAGLQVTVTELDSGTSYDLYATQTLETQESEESNVVTVETKADVDIVAVQPGDVENNAATTVTVQFTTAVTVLDPDAIPAGRFTIRDTTTDQAFYELTSVSANNGTPTVTFNVDPSIPESIVETTYELVIAPDALTTSSGANDELRAEFTF